MSKKSTEYKDRINIRIRSDIMKEARSLIELSNRGITEDQYSLTMLIEESMVLFMKVFKDRMRKRGMIEFTDKNKLGL